MIFSIFLAMMLVACGGDETTTPIEDDKMVMDDDKMDNDTQTPVDPPPEPERTYYEGTLVGHTGYVTSVAFSPDGSTIASGSEDNTIRLWNANDGNHIRTLTGHTSWVLSVAFSPDGSTVASGSMDITIRLWNASNGTHIRTLTGHTSQVTSVAFGRLVAQSQVVVETTLSVCGTQITVRTSARSQGIRIMSTA